MDHAIASMQACIKACTECHHTCLKTAMLHCLQVGGQHTEPDHFTLLLNCAEICQTSANLQLSASEFAPKLCKLCAEVCEACAASCEDVGDMDECVTACRTCAESCAAMAVA